MHVSSTSERDYREHAGGQDNGRAAHVVRHQETRNLALDGVRGTAFLLVFAFHVSLFAGSPVFQSLFSWGWMGVDLFFVLSGYLISGILIDSAKSPTFYSQFYKRRALRIAPAYALFLIIMIGALPLTGWLTSGETSVLRGELPWYLTFLTNVRVALHDWDRTPAGTGHVWSLAVEEQFYLIWPLLVRLMGTPKRVARASILLILVAFVLRLGLTLHGVSATVSYVLLPTRIDGLAWGAFLAAGQRMKGTYLRLNGIAQVAAVVGFALIIFVMARIGSLDPHSPSCAILGYTGTALVSAAAVRLAVARSRGVFAARPLRIAGRYSYGAYLWHLPTIVLLNRLTDLHGIYFAAVAAMATSGMTALSWTAIESPFLRLKRQSFRDMGSRKGWAAVDRQTE